jgi:hypothetical protein
LASAKLTEAPDSFVTDLPVGPDTFVELPACGRARWKIENETFNVLKNKGYNLVHSFGHGKQNLTAITIYLIFPSWDDPLLTLAFAKPLPVPA